MSVKNLKSENTGPPTGDNRKLKEGFMRVKYTGHQPEKYVPTDGPVFILKQGEPMDLPEDIGRNLCTQQDFEEAN